MRLRVRLAGCGAVLALGCVHPSWHLAGTSDRVLPWAFTPQDILGQGLIRTPTSLFTRSCLEDFKSVTAAGRTEVDVFAIDDSRVAKNRRLASFAQSNQSRARAISGNTLEPVSLVIWIRGAPQWTDLIETTVKFRKSILSLLQQRDWDGFAQKCGTDVVTSAQYQSSAYVFVSWFPSTAEELRHARSAVLDKLLELSDESFQLKVLDLLPGLRRFYSARTDSGDLLASSELPPGSAARDPVAFLVSRLCQSVTRAGRGELVDFRSRPWSTFGTARTLGPPSGAETFVSQRLAILEAELDQFWLRWRQAQSLRAQACLEALSDRRRVASPAALARCESAARHQRVSALERLEECAALVGAVDVAAETPACRRLDFEPQPTEGSGLEALSRSPGTLEAMSGPTTVFSYDAMEHRADAWESALLPEPVTLGAGIDKAGRLYPARCFEEEQGAPQGVDPSPPLQAPRPARWDPSQWENARLGATDAGTSSPVPPATLAAPTVTLDAGVIPVQIADSIGEEAAGVAETPAENSPSETTEVKPARAPARVFRVGEEYAPLPSDRWPWWKRVLLFWKKAPRERVIYRGVFEVAGASKRMAPDLVLSEEARGLAKKGLAPLFARCGTHYVAQIEHRRGFVYYLSDGGPADREISILPFGLSSAAAGSPLLKPRTVREFYETYDQIIALFDDDENALPVRLGIEPWVLYLKAHGMLAW